MPTTTTACLPCCECQAVEKEANEEGEAQELRRHGKAEYQPSCRGCLTKIIVATRGGHRLCETTNDHRGAAALAREGSAEKRKEKRRVQIHSLSSLLTHAHDHSLLQSQFLQGHRTRETDRGSEIRRATEEINREKKEHGRKERNRKVIQKQRAHAHAHAALHSAQLAMRKFYREYRARHRDIESYKTTSTETKSETEAATRWEETLRSCFFSSLLFFAPKLTLHRFRAEAPATCMSVRLV